MGSHLLLKLVSNINDHNLRVIIFYLRFCEIVCGALKWLQRLLLLLEKYLKTLVMRLLINEQ